MRPPLIVFFVAAGLILSTIIVQPGLADTRVPLTQVAHEGGLPGGLCVEVGGTAESACGLGRTGRFLVQVLLADEDAVARTRQDVRDQDLYGLVSVLPVTTVDRLPYAENLVNMLVLRGDVGSKVSMAEGLRVLCPLGLLVCDTSIHTKEKLETAGLVDVRDVGPTGQSWRVARKPWPAEMDGWGHPRHAADGNAVSSDTLVGPPRRVRWVAGPFSEVANVVSSQGRNYYGGTWARDGFNGLHLWRRELNPSPARGGFSFRHLAGSVRPIAAGDLLFVVSDGTVQAWSGTDGTLVREYPEAGRPSTLLHVDGVLIAVDAGSIRAVEVDSGKLRWKHDAVEPRYVVAGGGSVYLMEGSPRLNKPFAAVCLDLTTGDVRWSKKEFSWLPAVRRIVQHDDLVAFEQSTLNDTKEGNALHVVSADDGKLLWSKTFIPSMNHAKQARAMFIGDTLWVLEDRKSVALDPRTGEVKKTCPAGLCHCFPPVATTNYLFSGEMELTSTTTGLLDANRITKASCSRDVGWMPANGLIHVTPKHCVCWPMLRGYSTLAPAAAEPPPIDQMVRDRAFPVESVSPAPESPPSADDAWPCYRHDAWRSGSTTATIPAAPRVLWTTRFGDLPEGPLAVDWHDNPFIHGPLTPPVVAHGIVVLARPDAHEVVAVNAKDGSVRWRFTADGRVDTAPTIHQGLCLFGTKSGTVFCLGLLDGKTVWRLRAAPSDEQICAYGQLESPWPVPGSVMVIDDVAYFAAGRQPLADGGILVFAVEPSTGTIRWVKRLDTLPTENFYGCTALEFDNFDLMHREGDAVAMSRWLFDRTTGDMTCKARETFVRHQTGGFNVIAPRRPWTYAPRNQPRADPKRPQERPLVVFAGNRLIGCLQDQRTLYRRDFDAEAITQFDTHWITGWEAGKRLRNKTGDAWRSDRLANGTAWQVPALDDATPTQRVAAMLLADDTIFTVGINGTLTTFSANHGKRLTHAETPPPIWDGLAAASGHLYLSCQDGQLVCFGK